MTSKKSKDLGLGEFIVPIIDLMSIVIMKFLELIAAGTNYGLQRYVFKRNRKSEIKKIERKDLNNRKSCLYDECLGYSVTQKRNLPFTDIVRKKHSVIVGASGFGKSVLLDTLMYDEMQNGKPIIFIDPKGDNGSLEQFINLCKLSNREFKVFSEHYSGEGSIELNLVKDGSYTQVADRIHYSFDWSEEHYENLCYGALKCAIKKIHIKGKVISFSKILDKLIEISDPNSKPRDYERKDILGIITRLENIVNSDFSEKLDGSLSMTDVWNKGECIYIGLPVLGFPKIARSIGKIILGDLAYSVYQKYTKINGFYENELNPIGVYIDELSAIITDEFIELLNKCRGVKMELTFAFQSPSDINKVGVDLCEQILENCSNWFIMKQRMERGANLFAQAIGTIETTKKTMRVQDGEEQSQGSQRMVEELIVHANIIKNLNPGQCVLLQHGPTKVDLINVKYIDPKIVRSNIEFINRELISEV